MFISKGTEVTVKADYHDLKVGGKYIVTSVDILDNVVWILGHKRPYPPELFCEIGDKTKDKTENSDSPSTLQEILEVLKEINSKL